TGSSNLWIPNSNCTVEACQDLKRFNSSQSPIFEPEDIVSDGILGLAFDKLNTMDNSAPTFISTIIKQKTIDAIFSFHFQHFNVADDKGTFTLAIYKQIPGSNLDPEQGLYSIPCNTTAVVSLKFGGVNYEIPSRDLNFDKLSKSQCLLGILPVLS
ncbi:32247_t:CDS:2, partial [Gigaspora margarita]